VESEVPKRRPNGRLIFVGAIVAVLVLTPVVALLAGGEKSSTTARAGSGAPPPADVSTADVPHKASTDPSERPLPKPRPTVVDTQAGIPAIETSESGDGVPMEGGITGPGGAGNSRAEIEAQNQEYRDYLRDLRKVEKALANGRFPIAYGTGRLIWPLPGYTTISSPFGMRWGRLHAGIDIPAPIGTRIVAADKGTVVLAGPTGGYGNYTCVQHTRSLSTCYGHQSRILVSPGDDVRAGQVIGLSGNTGNSTGPHLHFETRNGGSPFDPMTFF
jgi:murein DD-endopeptidase MepM/ murein hydrolase activator NlpD